MSTVLFTVLMAGLVYAGMLEDHHVVQISGSNLGGISNDILLNDAANPDKSHYWIVGEKTILFSKNGRKWVKQYEQAGQTFNGIAMKTPTQGVSVGDGALIKRTDNGTTWLAPAVINDNWVIVNGINFFDVTVDPLSNNYWACGAFATIIKSTNNGALWTKASISVPTQQGSFNGIACVGGNLVVAVGDNGIIYKSVD